MRFVAQVFKKPMEPAIDFALMPANKKLIDRGKRNVTLLIRNVTREMLL